MGFPYQPRPEFGLGHPLVESGRTPHGVQIRFPRLYVGPSLDELVRIVIRSKGVGNTVQLS